VRAGALRFYQPFADRAASAELVAREAGRALALDSQTADALAAQFPVIPPFGRFVEAAAVVERLRHVAGVSEPKFYIGVHLVRTGRVREASEESERLFRNDPFNPIFAQRTAVGRMAMERFEEAVPVLENFLKRVPDMNFATSTPLRDPLRKVGLIEFWIRDRPMAGLRR
jgi:hypothetical protein